MLEVINNTPLEARLFPSLDSSGYDYATIVMKGNFKITPAGKNLVFSKEPAEIFEADVYYGEPDKTSVKYETDTSMYKRATDIVVNAHAYAPGQKKVESVDVAVQVANKKTVYRVYGDRYWEKSRKAVMSWDITPPELFQKIPVVYERAFGGIDMATMDSDVPEYSAMNPIGAGYIGNKSKPTEGARLPNIEHPNHLIRDISDKPPVCGFGYISRSWQPRIGLAGTYDEKWQKERNPLLPADFDDHFFNGAHPELISNGVLQGGEVIALSNLSEHGHLAFTLPVWQEKVAISIKGKKQEFLPAMDTVVIEPDKLNVMITWRVTVPCYKQFLYLDWIKIGKRRSQ